ncbi:MAG TPA: Maf family protein [Acidobacteriota bacterium]|nr:Maf family protein [Acidobacteriota bacterium]
MKKNWTNLVKNNQEMKGKIILASESPRRKTMLKELNIDFQEFHSRINETLINAADAKKSAVDLAVKKVKACGNRDALIIGMDSLVVLGKKIMGKPRDEKEAQSMLKRLSGKKHFVVTGIALSYKDKLVSGFESTDVFFRKLESQEIQWYISSGEPVDKAGAYAIQGIGRVFVRKINGCYFNVLGFPIAKFQVLLKKLGLTIFDLMS